MMRFSPKAGINKKPLVQNFRGNTNTHRGPRDHHPQKHTMNELGVLVKYDEHITSIGHVGKTYGWTCQYRP